MGKNYLLGVSLCLIAVLSWGAMFPIMGPALKIMDPFNFTLFRYGIVAVIFAIILFLKEGPQAFLPEKHFLKLWFLGTSAFAGFSFLVFLGQKLAGSSGALIASVMMAVQPLLGVIVGWIYRGTKPGKFVFMSMLVAAVGVFLVVTKGDPANLLGGQNTLLATILILLGALCWVIYTTGGADFKEWSILRYSTLTTIYGVISVSLILTLAISLGWLEAPTVTQVQEVSGALVYMITLADVLAVFAWNLGNRLIGALNGILFMNLVPVTAFVITILRGYQITSYEVVGCLLTISALVANNLYNRYKLK